MDYIQLISTLGFPIVACLGLGLFVKNLFDASREDRAKTEEQYSQLIERTTEAINNNTVALVRLIDRIGGQEDDIK